MLSSTFLAALHNVDSSTMTFNLCYISLSSLGPASAVRSRDDEEQRRYTMVYAVYDNDDNVQSSSRCVLEKVKRNFVCWRAPLLSHPVLFRSCLFLFWNPIASDEFRDYLNGLGGNNVNFADGVFLRAPPRDCTSSVTREHNLAELPAGKKKRLTLLANKILAIDQK